MRPQEADLLNNAAIDCVIAVSVQLTSGVITDRNDAMWREFLKSALPRCKNCAPVLKPIMAAAYSYAHAAPGRPKSQAFARLGIAVRALLLTRAADAADHMTRLLEGARVK